jgi:hypothetical protein
MTIVRVVHAEWQVLIEVPTLYGDAVGVARRLRKDGLAARKVGPEVHVNANAALPNLLLK